MAKRSRAAEVYDLHPSVRLMTYWVDSLKEKTGRSLDEWMTHLRAKGPATEAARRDWLKNEHDLGANSAWWLAERSMGKGGDDTPEGYLAAAPAWVEAMYEKKPGIRPVHDRIITLSRALGKDVKVCPCQTIVPIYRRHVIAQIKPSTKARLDFGLALGALMKQGKAKFPRRLIDTGGFVKKDRITHRFELAAVAEVDSVVEHWMRAAYESDAAE